ncbi:ABC transporter substrate-binding protein [Acuticoccus sp.]|uniref:ABC transporter substrate-binding protein n=1 Tax=Acuticoccus sp. TaxID=1904378 RepID=UPI003B51AB44
MKRTALLFAATTLVTAAGPAAAEETIKLGLSVPLSGAAAAWGQGAEFMCETAADEIREAGGVNVDGETYNFECVAYDNKYNAADGTKVAQTLLNREGVQFIGGSLGTAPVKALQSLSERQGVLLFTTAWGSSLKGPDYPLTFTQMNTPHEILPRLIKHIKDANPDLETVALLNPNDATGQETEAIARKVWENVGVKVLDSSFYERGTTEFQPIVTKLDSLGADAVDLGASPPADAGVVFKELDVLGWDGVKVVEVGTGAAPLMATAGDAAEGVYMGAAVDLESDRASAHQKAVNEKAIATFGEAPNAVTIGFYDALFALKAAMEEAGSVEPEAVAKALPEITFDTFYDTKGAFGGEATYGSRQQILLPVIVTQVKDGRLVEVERIDAEEPAPQ